MKASLVIDGYHQKTGGAACLYRGLHDTKNEDDIHFHRALIRQWQRQGWTVQATLSFIIKSP